MGPGDRAVVSRLCAAGRRRGRPHPHPAAPDGEPDRGTGGRGLGDGGRESGRPDRAPLGRPGGSLPPAPRPAGRGTPGHRNRAGGLPRLHGPGGAGRPRRGAECRGGRGGHRGQPVRGGGAPSRRVGRTHRLAADVLWRRPGRRPPPRRRPEPDPHERRTGGRSRPACRRGGLRMGSHDDPSRTSSTEARPFVPVPSCRGGGHLAPAPLPPSARDPETRGGIPLALSLHPLPRELAGQLRGRCQPSSPCTPS